MNHKQTLGKTGEDFAAWLLEGIGYKVLDRNWSSRYGEVDIIAWSPHEATPADADEGRPSITNSRLKVGGPSVPTLCFIEVRTSMTDTLGGALESLTRSKRSRLLRRARYYLATKSHQGPARMDFIAHQCHDGEWSTVFLPNAFESSR